MFLVGLTGGIGSGKSTVSATFKELGIPIIDADKIARQVVEPGTVTYVKLRRAFGDEYFDSETGQLNRKKLAALVFVDTQKRQTLNSIVHPAVRMEMLKQVAAAALQGHNFAILDVPLLFESKIYAKITAKIIVVHCDEQKQLQRTIRRDSCTEDDAKARINAQMPLCEKVALADYVIDNNGSMEDTKRQVLEICQKLRGLKYHWYLRIVLVCLALSPLIGCFLYFYW